MGVPNFKCNSHLIPASFFDAPRLCIHISVIQVLQEALDRQVIVAKEALQERDVGVRCSDRGEWHQLRLPNGKRRRWPFAIGCWLVHFVF